MTPSYNNTARLKFRIPQANQKLNDFTAIVDALGQDVDTGTTGWSTGTTMPAAGVAGRFFRNTSTGVLWFDDGTRWRVLPTLAPARVFNSTSGGIGGSGNWATLYPSTVSFDDEGAFGSSGIYTCPRPGKYHVMGEVGLATTSSSMDAGAGVMKNGNVVSQGDFDSVTGTSIGSPSGVNVNDIISCAQGDQLQLALFTSTGATVLAGSQVTYLTVYPLC